MRVLPLPAHEYTSLSLNIMDCNDDSFWDFENMPPESGYWDFIAHCDGRFCSPEISFSKAVLSAEEVIDLIENYSDWQEQGCQDIRLLACYAGQHSDGIAYEIHKALNVTVKAPRLSIWRNPIWNEGSYMRPYIITDADPNMMELGLLKKLTNINNPNDGWQYFPDW